MNFLEQRAGGQIFEFHALVANDLACIIKVILGCFQEGAGNIFMIGGDPENNVHIFKQGQPALYGFVRAPEILRKGTVGDGAAHPLAQKLDEGFDGGNCPDVFKIDDILPDNEVQVGALPSVIEAIAALQVRFGKAPGGEELCQDRPPLAG